MAGQRIVEVLRQPFILAGREVRISASIGIAYNRGCSSAEDLLRDADIAMYVAKNTGKGRLEVFEPDMRERAARRISLQQDVARAVDLQRDRGALPADHRSDHPAPTVARGAGPLAPPGRHAGAGQRVRADRRGVRGDRGDRSGGAGAGPAARYGSGATRCPSSTTWRSRSTSRCSRCSAAGWSTTSPGRCGESRSARSGARPGDHRERRAGGLPEGGRRAGPAPRPRRADLGGRLRVRLLVAGLPGGPGRRRSQDRPVAAGLRHPAAGLDGGRDRRARPHPRHDRSSSRASRPRNTCAGPSRRSATPRRATTSPARCRSTRWPDFLAGWAERQPACTAPTG